MSACFWGAAIPGLAMNCDELPSIPGLLRLQNPEVGDGIVMPRQYQLVDMAEVHLATLRELLNRGELPAQGFTIIGMSMGAMIASYLASHFRARLPDGMQFAFLVTSANTAANPAIPGATLDRWLKVNPSNVDEFIGVMNSFFAPEFARSQPEVIRRYAQYRAAGGNRQSPRAFYRQLSALRLFNGEETFRNVSPDEAIFIGAGEDQIFGPHHSQDLRHLSPLARHIELANTGHLLNIERPELFDPQNWRGL